jgi:hypothetical protein
MKTLEDSILFGCDALSVGKWFPLFWTCLVILCLGVSGVAKHCWYNRERATAGVSCGRFGTVHPEFKLSTYIQEPLVIGRRGCIQRAVNRKNC